MKTYVIKIGSIAVIDPIRNFQPRVASTRIQIVIIHGGGHYITELMEQFQIKRQIKNGLRVTDETT